MSKASTHRVDPNLIRALAHPLRQDILEILALEVASPNEISKMLDKKLSDVAFHVRALDKYECLELVDTAQRRGATEHFYRALSKTSIGHPVWRSAPRALLGDVTLNGLRLFARKVMAALKADAIGTYDETPIGSMTIMVDEAGEGKVRGLFHDLHAELTAIDAECRQRASDADLKPYVTAHALFPAPQTARGRSQ